MKNEKLKKLKTILKDLKSVVLAYSGGLDSTFLLKFAVDTLGKDKVLAVTARSETYPASEYKEAKNLARSIGARHITIDTEELKMKEFRSNPVNRCYYCKKELFGRLASLARENEKNFVLDGTNFDDLKDTRYGRKAAAEFGVRSPLLEAKIGKSDIRKASKALGLSTFDKPSFACLASRIPFGHKIAIDGLAKIEKAEDFLRTLGFRQVRVRLHADIARIEVIKAEFGRAIKNRDKIIENLKRLGFVYVTLDMAGYRTGSMHEGSH
jgi:uncharacterized protein